MCDIANISSSPLSNAFYSKQTAEHVIRDLGKDTNLTVRDLEQVPLSHVDGDFVTTTSLELKSSLQSTNGHRKRVSGTESEWEFTITPFGARSWVRCWSREPSQTRTNDRVS